jgi:hypothetical protein
LHDGKKSRIVFWANDLNPDNSMRFRYKDFVFILPDNSKYTRNI